MNFAGWIAQNWFTLLQSLGIVASLLFTAVALRADTKARRVDNLFVINESHRDVWSRLSERPELRRVLDSLAEPTQGGITQEEEIFVNSVLFHINGVYYARKSGLSFNMEGLRRDVGWFLSLPIPKRVWEKTKALQNAEFIAFVEECRLTK